MLHPNFADWYRLAHIAPTSEMLENRWKGVEQIYSSFDLKALLDVVHLMWPELTEAKTADATIEVFYSFDPLFPRRENSIELQVLAASVVIDALTNQEPSEQADVLALATLCTSFAGKRKQPIILEVLDAATNYLHAESMRIRQLDTLLNEQGKSITLVGGTKFQTAGQTVTAQGPTAENIIALNNALKDDVNVSIQIISQSLKRTMETQSKQAMNLTILTEEINVLWWVIGEFSRDLDTSYGSLSLSSACLIAAKELADLTKLNPGPPTVKHLLNKVLHVQRSKNVGSVKLSEAINKTPRPWRQKVTEHYPITAGNMTPVLMAIHKSLDTDGEEDWIPGFRKATCIDNDDAMKPLILSYQTYLECLLTRLLGG